MTVQIVRDVQTKHGRLIATKRVWTTDGGHVVTVETDACVNSRSTYGDRLHAYSRVIYKCECGKIEQKFGAPKKTELQNHDNWTTYQEGN